MAYFRKHLLETTSFPKEEKQPKVKGSDPMKAFWEYHVHQLSKTMKCQESNLDIWTSRNSICHIFPKHETGGYPSVAAHLANAMYYDVDIHNRFDRLLNELDFVKLEQEFPNSWPEVCEKAKTLLPLVKENGKLKSKFEEYLKDKEI